MVLQSYFDDSGNSSMQGDPYLTLAGLAAPDTCWDDFKKDWESTLKHHEAPERNGIPYFHAVEAFHGNGGFQDWDRSGDKEKVLNLFYGLTKVIHSHARDFGKSPKEIITFSCCVRFGAYEFTKKKIVEPKPIQYICFDHCLAIVLGYAEFKADNNGNPLLVEPFFGHEDQFFHKLRKLYRDAAEKDHELAYRMNIPNAKDGRTLYPLQAADLLAWTLNRCYNKGVNDKWGKLIGRTYLCARIYHKVYRTHHELLGATLPTTGFEMPKGTLLLRGDGAKLSS